MKFRIRKISHKITFFNIIAIFLCSVIVLLLTTYLLIENYLNEETQELTNIANGFITSSYEIPQNNFSIFYENIDFGDKKEITVFVTFENGQTRGFGEFGKDDFSNRGNKEWSMSKHYSLHFLERKIGNRDYTFVRKYSYSYMYRVFRIVLYVFLLFATIIIILSYFISKHLLKPIDIIINETQNIEKNNMDIRLPKVRDDEIGDLIDVINNMLSKLHSFIKEQQNFSSKVSHELKTPLTIIKGYSDILKWNKDEDMKNEFLENIDDELKNMENTISSLLFISQMKRIEILKKDINLSQLITKLKNDYFLIGIKRNIILKYNNNNNIKGDPHLVVEALRAILNNAIKYSNKDIFVFIFNTQDKTSVVIRDFGPGIPEELHKKVTTPFFKNSSKNIPGLGLGLHIAKEIIDLHHANIEFKNRSNGLDVILTFIY